MFELEEAKEGGFNFGITNFKEDALESVGINTKIKSYVVIENALSYNNESGYGIYLGENEKGQTLKLSGVFPTNLAVGLTYELKGKVISYRGDKQLAVDTSKKTKPRTKNGIVAYLKTMKGLYKHAELLYETFGEEVLDLLIKNPMKIAEVTKEIAEDEVTVWHEQVNHVEESEAYINRLLEYGLNLRQAKKLFDKHKGGVLEKIAQNPFMLVEEFPAFGFEKADKMARELGYDPEGMYRVQEGILHVLKEASNEGHCYLPVQVLVERAIEVLMVRLTEEEMEEALRKNKRKAVFRFAIGDFSFPITYKDLSAHYRLYKMERNRFEKEKKRFVLVKISKESILEQVDELENQNRLVFENHRYYLPDIHEAETKVAERIHALIQNETEEFSEAEIDLDALLKEKDISLESKQREAVIEFTRGRGGVYILNGSAGCGKTYTLNIILQVLERQYQKINRNLEVKVYAPTGKASKIAGKATGKPCMTIHRGLKFNPSKGFEMNETNPLDADCIVVDETSMIDILLAKSLLSAISDGTKVIFLGDTKQLSSVGAGNVLADLINSRVVKMVTLNVVKRQGKDSGIIRNANRIINGEMISTCKDTKDAYVMRKTTLLDTQLAMIKSVKEVQKVKGYKLEDIQVLCPQKTSLIGTHAMNYLIQQEFNHTQHKETIFNKKVMIYNHMEEKEELVSLVYKKGDKVIHIRNNYEVRWYNRDRFGNYQEDFQLIGITNGETGVIEDIVKGTARDIYKMRMIVRYEDKYVFYDDGFKELEHGFALSIHKSQGSQWKAVIIPIMMKNFSMLDNNLFYTGYTRAQSFCVVVGEEKAILYAIRTNKTNNRYTSLAQKIVDQLKEE